jgi:hypothetical protein
LFGIAVGLLEAIHASPPLTDPQKTSLHNAALPVAERKAAVPSPIWWNLIHYVRAKRMLARLAQDPNKLVEARDDAEKKFVEALVAQDKAEKTEKTVDELLDAVWEKRQTAESAESAAQRWLLESVRGAP